MKLKILGFLLAGVVILNLVLFALRVISDTVFWIVIAGSAVFVYFILPKLKALSPPKDQ